MNQIQLFLDNEMKLLQLFHVETGLATRKYCVDILITKHELFFHKEFKVIFKRVCDDSILIQQKVEIDPTDFAHFLYAGSAFT